jgi:hypothetical protein
MTAKMMWNAKDIPICERAKNKSFKTPLLVIGSCLGLVSFQPLNRYSLAADSRNRSQG